MPVNIKQTLTSKISDNALNLPSDLFPGVIQTAINYYLNGITIPIGGASLTVSGSGADLQLNMSPVQFQGSATASKATLKISGSGQYADANIVATFTKVSDSQVTIAVAATMGASLAWKLSDLWPSVLNMAPFNQVTMQNGALTLDIDDKNNIDFTGTGDIYYKGSKLASGALRIIYNGATTGAPDKSNVCVLAGMVVNSWSPGTIWQPLNDVVFEQSGLLFSSLPSTTSATLESLNLISGSDVPSIVNGDFQVQEGITFFTTLELDNFLQPLESLIGQNQTLCLYANSDLNNKLTILAKFGGDSFKPGSGAIFEFTGFELEWDLQVGTSYNLIASANGMFYPPDGSTGGIALSLSSTIKPQEGDIQLALSISNWVHPFGYDHLTVNNFTAAVTLGAAAEGVTLMLSGDFEFTTDSQKSFEFGVAGEITDFEVVTGVAFLLQASSPGQEISIGDLINGITSIDTSSIPGIDFINSILQVKNAEFAVVEGSSLTIGDKTFDQGFTANGDFDVLQQTEIILAVRVTGKGKDSKFSALAKITNAVQFGDVFILSAFNNVTKQPDLTKGPEMAVASDGIVVKGVNDDKPVYFYANGYLKVLDIIEDYLYGIATTDGLFQFTLSVQEGAKVGGSGTWGGYQITAGLNPSTYSCEASFDFNFGWQNVYVGPLSVFGVDLIPKVKLPDFSISAGLGIYVDGVGLTFTLKGEFSFSFLGVNINWGGPRDLRTIFTIDLGHALTSLSAIKDKIWQWFLDNITSLFSSVFNALSDFVNWAKDQLVALALDVKKVAEAIYKQFTQVADAIASALNQIGYAASQVYDALVNGLNFLASEAEKAIDYVYNMAKDCAVSTASVIGLRGTQELKSGPGGQVRTNDAISNALMLVSEDMERYRQTLGVALEPQKPYLTDVEMEIYNRGKKIRPLMLILSARMMWGGKDALPQKIINAAVSTEMLHVATLIHDDIIDHAPMRRGLPSVNEKRGTEMAILIGDLQFVQAIRCFTDSIDTKEDMALVRLVLSTAFRICSGEIDELRSSPEWDFATMKSNYFQTIERKTAMLFGVACECGVALGGGHTNEARRIGFYGRRIGRAFQIVDDVFDIAKSMNDAGKLPGTDLARRRLTLPAIYAMNELGPDSLVTRIMKGAPYTQQELAAGLKAIRRSNGFMQALLDARAEIIDSMRYLEEFPENDYKKALRDIAYYIINRRYD